MNAQYRVVRLLQNRIYPTYQLHAWMASGKTSPREGLRIAALTTLHWLRARLGEHAPEEWESLPDPREYRAVSDDFFTSFHLHRGYIVDIVSLPAQGLWTLQVTEPDLGSDPGNPNQSRMPIPGRVIETNVAFRVWNTELECGFKTTVSDPEGTGQRAEVYRLAVVRLLAQNPDFGLKQVAPLRPEARRISTQEQVRGLLALWHDPSSHLPCVVFTQTVEEGAGTPAPLAALRTPAFMGKQSARPVLTLAPSQKGKVKPDLIIEDKKRSAKPSQSRPPVETVRRAADPPYDFESFARESLSFCRVYLLEDAVFERFMILSGLSAQRGDILILEADSQGGAARGMPLKPSKQRRQETMEYLRREMLTYPRDREIDFGHLLFLSGARDSLLQETDEALRQARETDTEWSARLELLRAEWQTELARKDRECENLTEQLRRQREYQARLEGDMTALRDQQEKKLTELRRELAQRDEHIAYLQRKLTQPQEHKAIPDWVSKNFGGRLLLHQRAVELLSDKSAWTVDVELICDALDFLATDYWQARYERLPKEQELLNCSRKYGRPFEVTPTGGRSIEIYPREYKIKYRQDARGRLRECLLDYHLKVGNDAENLLRIYFLHDDEKRLIVVGSLPRHLRTATIQ